MTFYTTVLTSGSFTINKADGVSFLSVKTDQVSGSCTITGSGTFQGASSSPVTLNVGDGANLSSPTPSSPLDGITVTHLAGTVEIIIGS